MTTYPSLESLTDPFFSPVDLLRLDFLQIPKHVAIIMDGNRRWARRRNLKASLGHKEGAEVLIDIVRAASELGIETLTVYSFSTENWFRSVEEVATLMELFEFYLIEKTDLMVREGIKLETIGNLSGFPKKIQETITMAKKATEHCKKTNLVLALNYGSRDEIRRAMIKIMESKLHPEELTEELIASYLDTSKWGDPELMIRTSGELRLSNFLLWQISYSEFYVTEKLWPDFSPNDLLEAVIDYQGREKIRIMKDLPKRTIAAIISIFLVGGLIFFSDIGWFQYIVAAFVAALTAVAIWEYEQFVKAKGGQMILPALIAIGFIEVFSFFVATRFPDIGGAIPLLVFFIGFLILIALHFKQRDGAIVDLAVSTFGLIYIAIPMGMILGVLFGNLAGQDGRWWLGYLLVVTKISDMGAYFGGNLWGKRKLAPSISPGKTVEGAIIGLICAILASFIFFFVSYSTGATSFNLDVFDSLWLGLVLGCIGQFGDLSESLLKRDANKKDSNVLPGFGGILDLIDSLLFNAFIIFFYLKYL